MAATLTRMLFFGTGDLHAIINASSDQDLAAHKAPQGGVFIDAPKASYDICASFRDQLALAQPLVALKDLNIGLLITAKINAIDAAAQAAANVVDVPLDILP